MKDLFQKKTAKQELLEWILSKNWVRTSDVLKWGTENFSNRALRNSQQLCEDGLIRRMTQEEKNFYLPGSREDAFVPVDFK